MPSTSFLQNPRHWVKRRLRFLQRSILLWRRRVPIWSGGILIGLMAVVLAKGSHISHELFYQAYSHSVWWALLITPAGLGLSVWLMNRFFGGSAGGGIPQAIAMLEPGTLSLRERILSFRAAIGKIILTTLSIASGASFGYEGPIVQIGAAIKYSLGHSAARYREGVTRSLILAGGAAGVAAAFNAPLAGIVFAIEEMGRAFDQRASGTILLSVILAGLTAMSINGDYNYFGIALVTLDPGQSWLAIPVCGVVAGLIGALTARLLLALTRKLPEPLALWRSRCPVCFAIVCGIVLALIGIASDGITFGTGYWRARDIIEGAAGLDSYGILKLVTVIISFVSGAPGGIFSPSLAVGAGIGLNVASWFPSYPHTAMIMLGMVAFFSGMTRAPLTGFVIVMEMTDSSSMIFPLMVTALIAAGISRVVCRHSLYETQARLYLNQQKARESAGEN
ncbi:chloride channel protein [Paludibacterium paludis]|uniref:Chloride channel protein n=1 Tax=Paludibacterium paludis TaxID=1225769 RepID=A0A918UBP8_9NEIS|nr:chloride channel protein [Paludibacterium paludis]GGY27217.1 chloride channel protein [Paludibacterium paludis]